jgi:hypothetical protein
LSDAAAWGARGCSPIWPLPSRGRRCECGRPCGR